MNGTYEIVNQFKCCNKNMVTVKLNNAAHVMSVDEWNLTCNKMNEKHVRKGGYYENIRKKKFSKNGKGFKGNV